MRTAPVRVVVVVLLLAALPTLGGCSDSEEPEGSINPSQTSGTVVPAVSMIPQELATIPQGYFTPAEQQGTLVELKYDTWESMTYEQQTQKLTKRAIVYLPPGYSEGERYNVFYLMHGGWGNETTTLGTPDNPSAFKNVLDHAIAVGEIQPLIIVCPTYNNTSSEDSGSFGLALTLNENYHHELLNDLIPTVESTYSTYAENNTHEGLMAAREHRGFGGFSMGSVATWRTFQNGLDYFRYFLPMSCGTSLDEENIFDAANKRQDFFVWVITGTEDFAYSFDENRVDRMRESAYFTEADTEQAGNFAYRVKQGYAHDGRASMEYTYNGLRWFWDTSADPLPSETGFTTGTPIGDVIGHPAFNGFGRYLLPVKNRSFYDETMTLGDIDLLMYHTHISADTTVEVLNYLLAEQTSGWQVFFPFYSDAQRQADPARADTGLFFFRGEPGAPFALIAAGGGFSYVGSIHESFPLALELSRKGYNAFAIEYRLGSQQAATEDLAAALTYIFANSDALGVSVQDYSLWGGSAGARMVASIGSYGTQTYGGSDLRKPAAVIMQYTGHSDYTTNDPPTFACVGTNDRIASPATMRQRISALDKAGIATEFHEYPNLGHGFGLGLGTSAEGWDDDATRFWEEHMANTSSRR